MQEPTFNRDHVKGILSERLEHYMREFAADVTLNETNIHDKTLLRPAIAAKWCRYDYEEKRYKEKMLAELEDLKQKVTLKLYEKKKSSIVSQTVNETMIKIEADKILKASPQYLAKKADLESQDEVIRFIGEAKQIISQFGFDIKNSIDVLKLEQI